MELCEIVALGFNPSKLTIINKAKEIAQARWNELKNRPSVDGWMVDDAVVYALESIDGMGVDFDPTKSEYEEIVNSIK